MLMMALGRPHREEAAAGGGSDATISFTDSSVQSGAATTFTFSTQAFGSADATRIVVVGTASEDNGATDANITSMTIGGVAATQIVQATNSTEHVEIWAAAVPTGTTGDVVINYSADAFSVGIGVWALYNAQITNTDEGTDTDSNPATFALDIAAGGVALACVCQRSNTNPTFTWTNLTENYDEFVVTSDTWMTGASAAFASAQTNLSIEALSTQAGVRSPCMAVASFPKV
jgi:hypothetical protein